MAISNATRLSDFGSGIGTEGSVLKLDNADQRLGVGTDTPLGTLQVGTGVTVYGATGIVSASKYYGDGSTLDNAGSTVSASNGLERLVFTTVTSGTMSTCTTDSNVTWNQETSTLSVPNVAISGTMTHEDVNEIDSVGLVTAGLGFRATKGGLVVTAGVSTFGAAIDLNAALDVDGVVTATSYSGSGANLTGVGGETDITSCLFI